MHWSLGLFLMVVAFGVRANETELKLYRPFGDPATHQDAIIIHSHSNGECFQQSRRLVRENAWRCIANDQVYDPCFVNENSAFNQVVCPQSPWDGQALKIKLPAPLDSTANKPLDMSKAYPWAIELTSGERCLAVDEESKIDGQPVHYHCNGEGLLFGHLQRCKAMWSMLRRQASGEIDTAELARAWF